MVMPKIQIAPERIADGKRLYDLTLTPVADSPSRWRNCTSRGG